MAGAIFLSPKTYQFSCPVSSKTLHRPSTKGRSLYQFSASVTPHWRKKQVFHLHSRTVSTGVSTPLGCSQRNGNMDSRVIRALNPSMDVTSPWESDETSPTDEEDQRKSDLLSLVREMGLLALSKVREMNPQVLSRVWERSPLEISKWGIKAGIVFWVLRKLIQGLCSPFTYMYASWSLILWPWPVAILWGLASLFIAYRKMKGEAQTWEQFLMLGGALAWLIMVPVAHLNGYFEGWPLVFYVAYFIFFLLNLNVRLFLYRDATAAVNEKWSSRLPVLAQVMLVSSVVFGHWLAALEGPRLPVAANGWHSVISVVLLFWAMAWQYNATFYLAKYCRKLVEPVVVVMFGPFRWVRHPIYSSYMLLFASYCCAMQAYASLCVVFLPCLLYYDRKANIEERLLTETFKEAYLQYKEKVKYKFLPFVY
eukprot:TRINITY_DN4204_c0_g1_i1.p1 TRINITY_DN4204_c0_g1~~TRINITY_DN4204_c0_g1_i1.p1  ORF type:complete len:424 (-),score=48.19 TRINITY_DN4204_c0_g1_i1:160-1431(-)